MYLLIPIRAIKGDLTCIIFHNFINAIRSATEKLKPKFTLFTPNTKNQSLCRQDGTIHDMINYDLPTLLKVSFEKFRFPSLNGHDYLNIITKPQKFTITS